MKKNYYEEFTNLYSLSKTLRFELKPIGKTKKLLDESNGEIFGKDKRILEIYQNIIKPSMNKLHSYFIQASLQDINLNLPENIVDIYKKNKKEFEKIQKKLAKDIIKYLGNCTFYNAKGFKQLKDKKTILGKKGEKGLLVEIFGNNVYENSKFEDLNGKTYKELIEKYFKGFFTYLSTFNKNRANLYKDDLKGSRITTRILKDNLPRFLDNIIAYNKFKDKLQLNEKEQEIFDINNFSKYLNQEGIDNYNEIIGKINSKINEYNQKNNLKGKDKLPYLQILYKQILGESKKQDILNFVENIIESDDDLKDTLKNFIKQENKKTNFVKKELFTNFNIDKFKDEYDLAGVYLKRGSLKVFSNKYLSNWSVLESLLAKINNEGKKEKGKTKDDVVSLEQIKDALNNSNLERQELFKEGFIKGLKTNFDNFLTCIFEDLENLINEKEKNEDILNKLLLEGNFKENLQSKKIEYENKEYKPKQIIKDYLDKVLEIYRIVHNFALEKGQGESKENIDVEYKDSLFYDRLDNFLIDYYPFKIYNSIRNYLTKKPYKQDKIKVNFDNSTILDGWDKNKEKDNYGVILRKDGKYFLAIMKKGHTNIFDKKKNPHIYNIKGDFYEKMEYKLLPGPNKMLPKVFFSKSKIDYFAPSEDILNIREKESFKQGENFSLEDLHKWIDFMKESLYKHEEWKDYNFKFKDTKEYKNIKDFYEDIEKQGYKLNFVKVDKQEIDNLVQLEKLYLFEIYNKDFSPKSTGRPNLHTLYFKAVFEEKNLQKPIFKLNGKAEIFFRPKSIFQTKKRKLNGKEIIEHKRYTTHKLLFHVPITINFINKGINPKSGQINDLVRNYIKENNVNIIGIDRGEKHLLYLSLIDKNGKIIDITTLNKIMGVNYKEKLVEKEKGRDKERKSWDEIETIKELKEGYISQVVHYISKLAIKNNAIIVLENLNSGFKRGRQKVERQVYQKFELALAQKLNYLVFKDKNEDEIGSYYKGYQLTPYIATFGDIKGQTGIIFYTNPAYTSTTCPVCGFRKNIYIKYENIEKAKEFIKKLDIKYNGKDYIFSYDLKDFKNELKDRKGIELKKTKFTISTANQERIKIYKDKYNKGIIQEEINMKEAFDTFFSKYITDKSNLKESILNNDFNTDFYKDFIYNFNLLLQLRNSKTDENIDSKTDENIDSKTDEDTDYIQCPSCGFDSREGFQGKKFNADANGAYNIARKGIMITEKIKNEEKSLGITLNEWDNFVQE